jgi:hypothetical protein
MGETDELFYIFLRIFAILEISAKIQESLASLLLLFLLLLTSLLLHVAVVLAVVPDILAVSDGLLLLKCLLLLPYLLFWLSLCTKSFRRLYFRTITIGQIFILHDNAIGISKSDRR